MLCECLAVRTTIAMYTPTRTPPRRDALQKAVEEADKGSAIRRRAAEAAATAGAAGGDGGLPSNVKVVKIPAGTASAYGSPAGVSPAAGGYSLKQGTYIKTPGTQVKLRSIFENPEMSPHN